MKYSKIRVQDEPARLEWWRRKLQTDKDLVILSMSETMENKGTNRYFHIFADVARSEDMEGSNKQKP